jgi:hypothetical protein
MSRISTDEEMSEMVFRRVTAMCAAIKAIDDDERGIRPGPERGDASITAALLIATAGVTAFYGLHDEQTSVETELVKLALGTMNDRAAEIAAARN